MIKQNFSDSRNSPSLEDSKKKRKLSFKEQREWDSMEENIKKVEEELKAVTAESLKPENLSNAFNLTKISIKLADLQATLDKLYARWAELE